MIGFIESKGSNILFYLDTDFVNKYIIEIGIINAAGEKIPNQ